MDIRRTVFAVTPRAIAWKMGHRGDLPPADRHGDEGADRLRSRRREIPAARRAGSFCESPYTPLHAIALAVTPSLLTRAAGLRIL